MASRVKKGLGWVLETSAGILVLLFIGFPIFWLALTAFKEEKYVYTNRVLFVPVLDNFKAIFSGNPMNFQPYLVNSLIVSVATVLIAVPLAAMASYALSRYAFKGSTAILIGVLVTQFLPPVVIVLPFFTLFRSLGLVDTRISLVIVNLARVLPYAIWMIKGFVDALPTEIEEAGFVDGCNEFQVLRHVTFPLMMPSVITTAAFGFIMAWNEFLFALVLTRVDAKTLTVALLECQTHRGVLWEWMSATGLLVMIPIFVLSLTIRRHFVRGLTMGAVK